MKVTVKTLSNENFEVELTEADTGLTAKQKIAAVRPSFEPSLQKLIHAGKVLKDDEAVTAAGVKEGAFLVCMVSKPKVAAPAAAAPAPAPVAAPAPAAPAASAPAPASTTAPAVDAASTVNPFAGADFEAAVGEIKTMGFPEDQVRSALRAAFGNPDRAVDYLMNGIPAAATATAAAGGAGRRSAPARALTGSAAPSSAVPAGPLDALRQHPQFAQLKELVQTNPTALPAVLSQLGSSSPDVLALINSNKDAFIALMNEPLTEEEEDALEGDEEEEEEGDDEMGGAGLPAGMQQMMAALAAMPPAQRAALAQQLGMSPEQAQQLAAMVGAGAGGAPPGSTVVRLTAEEAAAVDRLTGMGFDRQRVLEAYLACDKNEELAANMLLEGGFEDS